MRLLIALLLIGGVLGQYSLTIYLRRLDVGQGYLLNGTHCTDNWNLGDQCNLQLKLGVCLGTPSNREEPCPDPTPIDLSNVTFNSNAVDFMAGGTTYGAWRNPSIFPNTNDTVYAGFSLLVEISEARDGAIIDCYQHQFDDGTSPNNFMYYSHPRTTLDPKTDLDPTMLSIAWKATGNLPTPSPPPTTTEAPTTEAPTTPTPTVPSTTPFTGSTTTTVTTTQAPVTAKDCDEVQNKTNGVHPIRINNDTVEVYCSFANGQIGLTHIQGRGEKDNRSFDVPFEHYQTHFGNAGKGNNFWLGLDNMHQLTVKNGKTYSLMIEVCCGTKSISKQYYTEVQVSDLATGYVLTGNSTLGLGLNYTDISNGYGTDLGRKFVTYESWGKDGTGDNEYCPILGDTGNSSRNYTAGTGGWWFGNCRENLSGYYYSINELEEDCKIKNIPWTKGSGIEFVTLSSGEPVNGVSYTRTRMALYQGAAPPSGVEDFCS